jgi:hypothetical protein
MIGIGDQVQDIIPPLVRHHRMMIVEEEGLHQDDLMIVEEDMEALLDLDVKMIDL